MSRTYTLAQRRAASQSFFQRARANRTTHPYVLLTPGSGSESCLVHAGDYDCLYGVDSTYWRISPLHTNESCYCSVRAVSKREAAQIEKDGITVSDGPILKNGLPTGHVKTKKVPLRGIR